MDGKTAWHTGKFIFIILHQDQPAGVLRLDRTHETDQQYEVSTFVNPEKFKTGIAVAALSMIQTLLPEYNIIAKVLPENRASHSLFQKAGFKWQEDHYIKEKSCSAPIYCC